MFSVISSASFSNVFAKWIPEARHHVPHVPIILIGTKIDLREDENIVKELEHGNIAVISKSQAMEQAKLNSCVTYIETSAKTGENVRRAFEVLLNAAKLETLRQEVLLQQVKKCIIN